MDNAKQNLINGALIADAATLGLHWIYDQQRIIDVAGKTPEFHPPTKRDYEGVPSFFAHGSKSVGDLSHYGEQAFVLLSALSNNAGKYNKAQYQTTFRKHFSYGGDYVGYIDRPTRDTLDNITIIEHNALKQAKALTCSHPDEAKQSTINLVLIQLKENPNTTPERLKEIIASDIKVDIDTSYLGKLINSLTPMLNYHGADDVQLPAISKLPALVAVYAGNPTLKKYTESAVRVTNNNDLAVSYGQIASKMMETAIITQDIDKTIEAGRQAATAKILPLLDNALNAADKSTSEFTQKIGMSCNLEFGIASVFHTLNQHLSFEESIRQNSLAAGDSCGRSILLGAILGAIYGLGSEKGIPVAWHQKLSKRQEVERLQALL